MLVPAGSFEQYLILFLASSITMQGEFGGKFFPNTTNVLTAPIYSPGLQVIYSQSTISKHNIHKNFIINEYNINKLFYTIMTARRFYYGNWKLPTQRLTGLTCRSESQNMSMTRHYLSLTQIIVMGDHL